ncbi:MAG: glycine--tRNA ligase subunit beta [Collinsella sp.]
MGENDEVAHAIRDHYRPALPAMSCPSARWLHRGLRRQARYHRRYLCHRRAPTGSSDPYALRRAAIGIINILRDRLPIDPTSLIDFALELYSEQGIEFDAAEVASRSATSSMVVW